MMKDELIKALGPVKRRLRTGRLIRGAAAGFALGAAAALVLMAVSVFVPVGNRWALCAALCGGGILAGAAVNALRPLKNAEAARAADACGLRERAVTALEMAGRKPEDGKAAEMLEAQRRDACERLRELDPRRIRLAVPLKVLAAGAVLLAVCAGLSLIRGGGVLAADARRELREKTAQMAEQIDTAAAEEEAGKSEPEKAELRRITEDLKRELDESRDSVEALVALDRAEQRLEEMRRKTAGDAAQELADAMRGAGMEAAAEAMENGDVPGLAAEAAGLDADALREAAEGLSGEAREMAEQLARAAQQGEMSEAQMQALSEMMAGQNGGQQGSPMQQAIAGMQGMLGKSQQQGAGASQQGSAGGENGTNSGGGAGTGTTNEEQQGAGQQQGTGSKGSRPPEFRETQYETIYDPERVEAATRDVTTEQHSGNSDSVQIEAGTGKGTAGGNIPYREVVGEYAEAAAQAAESEHLSVEQRRWVDEYFRQLTEE